MITLTDHQRVLLTDAARISLLATLTDRQRAVLDPMAQGLSNAEIAAQLGIATKTVNNHLWGVYGALRLPTSGSPSRRAIALWWAAQNGTEREAVSRG